MYPISMDEMTIEESTNAQSLHYLVVRYLILVRDILD